MLLGILLVLTAATAYNGSAVLLALAARSRPEPSGPSLLLGVARRAPGTVGIALTGVGWLTELLALTRIPLTLDKVVMTSGFVILLLLARWQLGEPVGHRQLAGVAAVGAGILAVGIMPLVDGVAAPSLARWILVVVVLAPVVLGPSLLRALPDCAGPLPAAVGAGVGYALSGLFTKGLADSFSSGHALTGVLMAAGVAGAGGLGFLNELAALRRGRAAAVVPVIAALQTVVPIAVAPLLLAERWPELGWQRSVMVLGILLNLLGLVVLARASASIVRQGTR